MQWIAYSIPLFPVFVKVTNVTGVSQNCQATPCAVSLAPSPAFRPTLMNFKKFVQTSHYGGLAT
jgi:hypothetical protein